MPNKFTKSTSYKEPCYKNNKKFKPWILKIKYCENIKKQKHKRYCKTKSGSRALTNNIFHIKI